jgi:predicted RNA binding protein YcfA (HicA-like mRNA interferase family)
MPQVSGEELLRFLLRRGFVVFRITGSHYVLVGPNGEQVVVPVHRGRDLGRGIAVKILNDAGYTPDDYMRLK